MATPSWPQDFGSLIQTLSSSHFSSVVNFDVQQKTRELLNRLPGTLSSFFGYELHLDRHPPRADFLFCVHLPAHLKGILTKRPESRWGDLPFSNLGDLRRQWQDDLGFLEDSISNFWFEIDEPHLSKPAGEASFFFAPKEGLGPIGLADVTQSVWGHRSNPQDLVPSVKTLVRLATLLKNKAEIVQIGQMRSRGEVGLRVFVQGLSQKDVTDLLRAFDYPYEGLKSIKTYWDDIIRHGGEAQFNFDLLDGLGAKVGLESYYTNWSKAKAYLNHQVLSGLAHQEASIALENDVEKFKTAKGRYRPFFSHFKLNITPSDVSALKAYIAFTERHKTPRVTRTHH